MKLQSITIIDLIVYLFFCILLFVWLQRKRSDAVKLLMLVLVDCLSLSVCCAMCTIIVMCFMCKAEYETISKSANVYEVGYADDTAVNTDEQWNCFVLKEDFYTTTTGVVCCSIYTETDKVLTKDDIIAENFCEFIEVIRDEAAENKYNVLFSGFLTENGDYTVAIRNTACSFTVHISDELSDRINMECTYSAADINVGDTISLLLEYRGLDIVNGTAQMQYDDSMVLLRNCVGGITGIQRENNTVCVTIENIGILDLSKEASVEIAVGTMVDSMGMLVNGAVVELKIMEK